MLVVQVLKPLKQACGSGNAKLVEIALGCLHKLVSPIPLLNGWGCMKWVKSSLALQFCPHAAIVKGKAFIVEFLFEENKIMAML